MLYFTDVKQDCTGCGACQAVCPTKCITNIVDEEGFWYPNATSECIDCGMCEEVCPIVNSNYHQNDAKQYCIVGKHDNDDVWLSSTSGGAFSAICQVLNNSKLAIFGAKYLDVVNVIHDYVTSINEIDCFKKSKYTQSNMNNCYLDIKEMLLQDYRVVFSGTPCQVAGVKNFLGKDYDNLLCIDLICHGVGSPKIFAKYIEYLEKEQHSSVISFNFRSKKIVNEQLKQDVTKTQFANGKIIENENDIFYNVFIQALILRPSCGECIFANTNRVGDLTIGDFNNMYELMPEVEKSVNFSTIIVNTEKGNMIKDRMNKIMETYPAKLKNIAKYNSALISSTKMNENRSNLFMDLKHGNSVEDVLSKYVLDKS
ncbi:MAG: Coenzyme F420 hydrogenase/dehydrogenase, beta subunit C-terminal domain [Dysgonamonadaceae bacterium]|nr:Coenzyme F420 hydrogenase/dehydrogenase, beta subunit C-terminal domain [Dysgonamonadaceae bacterium]